MNMEMDLSHASICHRMYPQASRIPISTSVIPITMTITFRSVGLAATTSLHYYYPSARRLSHLVVMAPYLKSEVLD